MEGSGVSDAGLWGWAYAACGVFSLVGAFLCYLFIWFCLQDGYSKAAFVLLIAATILGIGAVRLIWHAIDLLDPDIRAVQHLRDRQRQRPGQPRRAGGKEKAVTKAILELQQRYENECGRIAA
jgi:hypothetical protein